MKTEFSDWWKYLPDVVKNDILRVLRGDIPMTQDDLVNKYTNYGLTKWKINQIQKAFGFTHSTRDDALLNDRDSGKYTDDELKAKYGLKDSEFNLIVKYTRRDEGKSIGLF